MLLPSTAEGFNSVSVFASTTVSSSSLKTSTFSLLVSFLYMPLCFHPSQFLLTRLESKLQ
ncbi:hypothetical protein A2U01_0058412, partial [Trifolium medium]|nr:hypothetical protein [Trifolium medium]